MMVGPSGSGKTSAWRCLLSALEIMDGVKGEAHVIDPKAIGVSGRCVASNGILILVLLFVHA